MKRLFEASSPTKKQNHHYYILYDENAVKKRSQKNIKDFWTYYDFDHADPSLPNVAFSPFWEELYENAEYTETLNKATGTKMVKQIVDDHCSVNVTALRELLNHK